MDNRPGTRFFALVLATLILAIGCGGCGGGDSNGGSGGDSGGDRSPGSSPTRSGIGTATVAERFDSVVPEVLKDEGFGSGQPAAEQVKVEKMRLGADGKPNGWRAHGFPKAGLPGVRRAVIVKLPGRPAGTLQVVLWELDLPESASACEAPWQSQPQPNTPCRVSGLSETSRLMTAEYSNYRGLYVMGPTWVLDSSTYTLGKGRSTIGKRPPLTKQKQRAILLGIAEQLPDGPTVTSKAPAARTYTAPGTKVSLQIPQTWDAQDGVARGTINVGDTASERSVFLEPAGKEFTTADADRYGCRVVFRRTVEAPGSPGEKRTIQATVTDTRELVGLVSFEAFITTGTGKVPCDAVRGVKHHGGTALVRQSTRFDTIEQAEKYVRGPHFAAIVDVMASLTVH